jgi:Xaa-Pro dipeptidase
VDTGTNSLLYKTKKRKLKPAWWVLFWKVDDLKRIEALRKVAFKDSASDGYLIFNSASLTYFIGFQGPTGMLVPPDGESILYVYGTNYELTKAEGKGFRVEKVKSDENLIEKIARQAKDCKINHLTVDAIGVEGWQALAKEFPKQNALEVNNAPVEALRRVKDAQEIELMRKAGKLTSEGMKAACEIIRPGVKECEVAGAIEYAMRKGGAGSTAFESIIASGPSSAFPHGGCSERVVREGDFVMVDIGATYKYYCSDMTRTFVAGKPSTKQQIIYDVVKDAQESAFKIMRDGVRIADVDIAARQVIEAAGFGYNFVHRIGHGVGLEVHEPPSLNQQTKDLLIEGNVITIEPGIYLPGFGGVRIEDTILIQKNCAEKLTNGPYSLNTE